MARPFVTFLLLAAIFTVLPIQAGAHAEADRSIPEMNAVVAGPPAQVEIWFTEELSEGSTATVIGPDGARVDNEDAAIDLFDPDRKHLVVTLRPNLPAGEYTVRWTSVSGEDDDTDSGTFTFTVSCSATPTASPVASPAASPESTPSPDESAAVVATTDTDDGNTINTSALLIALGVGAGAAALIYGFWLLVKPKSRPVREGS